MLRNKKNRLILLTASVFLLIIVVVVIALSGGDDEEGSLVANFSSPPETCLDDECFDQRFEDCTPTIYDAESEDSAAHYEIYESQVSGCVIKVSYTKNLEEQDLVGKEMICQFDSDQGFTAAVTAVFADPISYGCEGDLVEAISL